MTLAQIFSRIQNVKVSSFEAFKMDYETNCDKLAQWEFLLR